MIWLLQMKYNYAEPKLFIFYVVFTTQNNTKNLTL